MSTTCLLNPSKSSGYLSSSNAVYSFNESFVVRRPGEFSSLQFSIEPPSTGAYFPESVYASSGGWIATATSMAEPSQEAPNVLSGNSALEHCISEFMASSVAESFYSKCVAASQAGSEQHDCTVPFHDERLVCESQVKVSPQPMSFEGPSVCCGVNRLSVTALEQSQLETPASISRCGRVLLLSDQLGKKSPTSGADELDASGLVDASRLADHVVRSLVREVVNRAYLHSQSFLYLFGESSASLDGGPCASRDCEPHVYTKNRSRESSISTSTAERSSFLRSLVRRFACFTPRVLE